MNIKMAGTEVSESTAVMNPASPDPTSGEGPLCSVPFLQTLQSRHDVRLLGKLV